MSEQDAIDGAAFDDLVATTGGDPIFVGELIDTYFEDTAVLLPTMRQAVADARAEELRRAAHSLKSNSASFGANHLARLCRELEDQGRGGALAGAAERLVQIEAEVERVKRALESRRMAG